MPTLGERMKGYEHSARFYLTRRMPMIIRCDGKAFHSFTKGFEKPWDDDLRDAMTEAAKALLQEISGGKIAYIQSDEISVLVTDYDSLEFEPWFSKSVQKTCSVSASIATMAFNRHMTEQDRKNNACFDARCFILPESEVNNYFIWRQQDAVRNSIQGYGQRYFSHKQLHKKNCGAIQEMLFQEKGINWNDVDTWKKRGWCVTRKVVSKDIEGVEAIRTSIEPDWEIPTFTQDREYIEKLVRLEKEDEQ